MIRAVLLDALGTLLELEDPGPPLARELAARGSTVTVEQARQAMRAEMRFYRAHHDQASDQERLERLRDRCAEVLASALPASAATLPSGEIRDAMMASIRFRPYEEVPGVLRELRAGGTRLVVVSNWDVSLHEQLDVTGIAELVDGALSSAELGAAKPDPAAYAAALELAGVDAGEALMVGDTFDSDVAGARAAGIAAVFVDRRPGVVETDDTIATLSPLPRLVRSLP